MSSNIVSNRNSNSNSANPSRYLLAALAGLSSRAVDSATRQVVSNLMAGNSSSKGGVVVPQRANVVVRTNGNGGGRRRRSRGGARGGPTTTSNNADQFSTFSIRTIPERRMSMRVSGTTTLNNDAANVARSVVDVGFNGGVTGAVTSYIFTWLSMRDRGLLGAFSQMRVRSLVIRYTGTVSTTTPGFLAVGYSDDATLYTTALPASLTDVTAARQSVVGDVKGVVTLRPKLVNRVISLNDTTEDYDHKSLGRVLFYGTNGALAGGTTCGVVTFEADIDVW